MFSRFFSIGGNSSANENSIDNQSDDESDEASSSFTSSLTNTNDGTLTSFDEQSLNDPDYNKDDPLLPEELCEIPTFLNTSCCDKNIIEETRRLLKKKYLKRPDSFYDVDYDRMMNDDWTVSRFLLRCRQDPKRTAKLMEQCGKFRKEFKMGISQLSDFPIEFHKAGGLFRYAPDRVGNQTLFMRVKMHRRIPELSQMMKEFILCALEECDRANNGRGTAVIFDLTGCGLQNADPGFSFWLVYSFKNYCPKGLSYIMIYNLPWILNATAKLVLSWLSSTNRRRMRFVSGDGIQDFIAPENLPDYMGGTCKLSYRHVPEGARPAEETAEEHNLTKEQSRKIREIYAKFLKDVDSGIDIDDLLNADIEKAAKDGHDNNNATPKSSRQSNVAVTQ